MFLSKSKSKKESASSPEMKSVLLVSSQQERASKDQKDLKLLTELIPFAKPQWFLFLLALISMPLSSAVSLFQPLLIKRAIDASIVEKSAELLSETILYFTLTVIFDFVIRFSQAFWMQLAGQRTMVAIREKLFSHAQKLSLSYYDKTPVGRIVTRITNDVDGISELFVSGAVTAISDVITLVGIVGFMLYLDWQLSLVAFLVLPPLALLVNVFRKYARVAFQNIRLQIAQLNTYLAEQVEGLTVVQAYAKEKACAEEYEKVNSDYRDSNFEAIRYDALLFSVVESVSVATIAIILWFASVKAGWVREESQAALYVGTVVAFYEYIQRFFIPIRDLATKFTIVQSSLASAERILSFLKTDQIDASFSSFMDQDSPAHSTSSAIEFENVTFGYNKDHPVLKNVSFNVKQGEKIAIVGATGSGKTTTVSLLARLYELNEGHIWIAGKEIRSIDKQALRELFSFVQQDTFLFKGTVFENLCLLNTPNSHDEKLSLEKKAIECLQKVGLWKTLASRQGLDTIVSERGENLSAGEKQLLSFARALFRDTDFLILDEATANVDSDTESKLQKAVSAVVEQRTSLIIAHRLSTIQNADRIIVFHHGKIAEQGTHLELLEKNEIYARLYKMQYEFQPA